MFQNLTEKLEKSFKILKGHGRINEINVAQTLKEIRRALIDSDVAYKTAKEFIDKVKVNAMGQEVLTALQPGQLMVKIVKDELANLMGDKASELNLNNNFSVILLAGLQGSGKTTFSAKLAKFLQKKKNLKPLLVACDVYRPAAIDQLEFIANQINVEVYKNLNQKDPVIIAKEGVDMLKKWKKFSYYRYCRSIIYR